MPPQDDVFDVDRWVQGQLDIILGDQTRDLTVIWQRAMNQVADELEALQAVAARDGMTRSRLLRTERWRNAMRSLETALNDAVEGSVATVHASLDPVPGLAATGQVEMVKAQLGNYALVIQVNRPNQEALDAIIQRTRRHVHSHMWDLQPEASAAIRARLISGVATGDNPVTTARKAIKDVEGEFAGGLARAVNIARTETMDAYNKAAYTTDQTNQGVLRGWQWYAHLDSRTCRSCVAMHGEEFPLDEEGPLDHHRGRCARIPLVKSWRDLGFDIDDPDPIAFTSGEDWLSEQPEKVQADILGKRGRELWLNGQWPIEQWTKRVENPEWRAGYFPAKPPKGTTD
ncbi:phage minor head protein [Dermabacteraceae bacterium P7006]